MLKQQTQTEDLELLTTEQLVDELKKRFDTFHFMGIAPTQVDDVYPFAWDAKGNPFTLAGLLKRALDKVSKQTRKAMPDE